jgi:hypothetical protein
VTDFDRSFGPLDERQVKLFQAPRTQKKSVIRSFGFPEKSSAAFTLSEGPAKKTDRLKKNQPAGGSPRASRGEVPERKKFKLPAVPVIFPKKGKQISDSGETPAGQ